MILKIDALFVIDLVIGQIFVHYNNKIEDREYDIIEMIIKKEDHMTTKEGIAI